MAFTQRAAAIWRDYITPLNPLSGINKPRKSELRTWGKEVEDQLEALAAAAGFDPSILSQLRERLAAEEARSLLVAAAATRADAARASQGYRVGAAFTNNRLGLVGGLYGPGDFMLWTRGVYVPRVVEAPHGFQVWLAGVDRLNVIRAKFYRRPASVANGSDQNGFQIPGTYENDVLLDQQSYAVSEIAANPNSGEQQPIRLTGNFSPFTPDYVYFFTIEAEDKSGNPAAIAIARGRDRINGVDTTWGVGVGRTAGGSTVVPGDGGTIAVQLLERVTSPVSGAGTDSDPHVRVRGDYARTHAGFVPGQAAFQVNLPEAEIDTLPVPLNISMPGTSSSIYAAQAASGAAVVNGESVQLVYNQWTQLAHRNVAGVSLTSGSSTLVSGTDFEVRGTLGQVRGLKNVPPISATAAYNFSFSQYVDLVIDPFRAASIEIKGSPRDIDPNEYLPASQNFKPWARIYVNRAQAELIPLWEWNGFARRGEEARLQAHTAYNRARLSKTLTRAHAGQSVRIIGYGDSITAFATINSSEWYTPNGGRDALYFMGYPPADTRATIQTYDGPLGSGQHVKIGWNWQIASAIEALGGLADYQNLGIAGTTSRNEMGGAGPGGAYPQRLDAAIALDGDLATIAFGMNEVGSDQSFSAHVTIINRFKAAGVEVYVITPPRPNDARLPLDWWLYTTREIIRAAQACNVAYCDLSAVSGPGNEGCIGISSATMCEQNYDNHPGLYEYNFYGKYISLPFRGL